MCNLHTKLDKISRHLQIWRWQHIVKETGLQLQRLLAQLAVELVALPGVNSTGLCRLWPSKWTSGGQFDDRRYSMEASYSSSSEDMTEQKRRVEVEYFHILPL